MSDSDPLGHPCTFQATTVIRQWKVGLNNGLTSLELAEMKTEKHETIAMGDSRRPNGTAATSQGNGTVSTK